MNRISLPSHEEILNFAQLNNTFFDTLLQLSHISLQENIEVAFKIETNLNPQKFHLSELGKGNEYSAHAGESTCPYSWSEKVTVFGVHSHLDKKENPKAAIFSIDDLFNYLATLNHNVSVLSTTTGISEKELFNQSKINPLHQEGIVKSTLDSIGILIYQPPMDIIKPSDKGYNLAKPNNHYVDMIKQIGRNNLDHQQQIIDGLRNNSYTASYLKFDTKERKVIEQI